MNILLISDTHEKHEWLNTWLKDPEYVKDVDMIIHAGDSANSKVPGLNFNPQMDFIHWYSELDIKYKIYVPGNHNTSERMFQEHHYSDNGIIRLIHQSVEIEGLKIFGSPYTPTFGIDWAYNINRSKIYEYWQEIPEDTDIVVTHGPPLGIGDLTGGEKLEQVGDRSLLKRMLVIKPKLHVFGHLHDEPDIINHGLRRVKDIDFVNASVVDLYHKPINKPVRWTV